MSIEMRKKIRKTLIDNGFRRVAATDLEGDGRSYAEAYARASTDNTGPEVVEVRWGNPHP